MLLDKNIGKKIKFYRNLRNEKLEDMEEKLGLSLSTLKRIEANGDSVSLFNLNLICTYLRIDITDIINSCLHEDYILAKETLKIIESKINRYNYQIYDELDILSTINKSSILSDYLALNSILDFYNYLVNFENGNINVIYNELKNILKNKNSLLLSNRLFSVVNDERYKMLYANTCASVGNIKETISIHKEIIATSNSPFIIAKARINLAKHYYANKDYRSAYECTLETIPYLYKHSIIDKLQAAFWMKGICELKLNLDFTHSIESAVNSAYYSRLNDQYNIYKNYARDHFDLDIKVPNSTITIY